MHSRLTASLTVCGSGVRPVASSPARDATARTADSTSACAAWRACSACVAAAARFSAMRVFTAVSCSDRSDSSVDRAASMRCCASPRMVASCASYWATASRASSVVLSACSCPARIAK